MRTVSSATSSVASGEPPQQVFCDARLRDAKYRVATTPEFPVGTRIADTHAHLDMLHHPGLALARAAANGVSFVVSVIDPTEDPSFTLDNVEPWQHEAEKLLAQWGEEACPSAPDVRIIMGCHPHSASSYDKAVEGQLAQSLASDSRVAGIGEIGLDYHYDNSPRDVQRQVFRRQIQLAHEHGSAISLHLREAHADGLRILKEEGLPDRGVLLHCFNLDYATLEPFLELGAMVAFGGPLTFKKSDDVRDAAARSPLERLVTETDCPFMAPVPVRGSVCEPASVVFTANVLAGLRKEPDAEVLRQIYANARELFS